MSILGSDAKEPFLNTLLGRAILSDLASIYPSYGICDGFRHESLLGCSFDVVIYSI